MLEHHIQREIVRTLAFATVLRFSELKPDGIENKLFDYHLKIVMRDGYVEKTDEGYRLTVMGRRSGKSFKLAADKAYSILFMVVRRKEDGAWLLMRRRTHPVINKVGFMLAAPTFDATTYERASTHCEAKTGLTGTFKARGSGFLRMFNESQLESFVHFTMLVCEDAQGELIQNDETAEYFWVNEPDFTSERMVPTMQTLSAHYLSGEPFFLDEQIEL